MHSGRLVPHTSSRGWCLQLAGSAMVRCRCLAWWRGSDTSSGDEAPLPPREALGQAVAPPAPPQPAPPRPAPPKGDTPKLRRTELPLRRPEAAPGGSVSAAACAPLRVMTFNILADGLAQHGDFVHAPQEVLSWSYRFPRIIEEVVEGRCDIVCLQEANHYDEIAAALAGHGFAGFFQPKRPAPPERFGAPPDGTALFYRAARLSPAPGPRGAAYAAPGGRGAMTQGFVIATLADAAAGGRLVVAAATHLKAKEGAANDETRRLQAQQLLAELSAARAAAAAAAPGGPEPGVLVMGDFNAVPASPACQAMAADPELQLQSIWTVPWADAADGDGDGAPPPPPPQQQQQQQQATGDGGGGGEPEFTTWKFRPQGESRRVIDHLFFSPAALAPAARWRMPGAADVGPGGLPCAAYPSDHMAVMCELAWR
ncbi:MAG: DNase I-like protein [Monoraphidium minutum]|nr:MAG: DNase I-like protein [Monoraphidium minutum]